MEGFGRRRGEGLFYGEKLPEKKRDVPQWLKDAPVPTPTQIAICDLPLYMKFTDEQIGLMNAMTPEQVFEFAESVYPRNT